DERVTLWGTGSPSREYLYVYDASRALLLAAERLQVSDPVNVGTGVETTIRDLAETIERLVGFSGETVWDPTRPDGQPRRFLDISRARELMAYEPAVSLEDGLGRTIASFREQPSLAR
ncbi:MAG: GDP-L-fucose synthase, partial [Solirubrobacteraceae bacterium]|nr:GDP-L-fucose synthase [Solirubrobacteraceae bacterium]